MQEKIEKIVADFIEEYGEQRVPVLVEAVEGLIEKYEHLRQK